MTSRVRLADLAEPVTLLVTNIGELCAVCAAGDENGPRRGTALADPGCLPGAALAILVCGDENLELSKGYWPVDCAAATQNILLAAHALGLGAVWLGVYPRQERQSALRKIFGLPSHVHAFSLISIGYPAEEKGLPDRLKKDRIRWNEW